MTEKKTVSIHGKEYKPVALRVSEFRGSELYNGWSIITDMVQSEGDMVVIKASVLNDADRIIATGYAEEVRGSTNINKTSALENCETSAIGRALACLGLAGTEYASADEVSNAITQQNIMAATEGFVRMNQCIRENLDSIVTIKAAIAMQEFQKGAEAWFELDNDVKKELWAAPTKGGIFTTLERESIRNDFKQFHPNA